MEVSTFANAPTAILNLFHGQMDYPFLDKGWIGPLYPQARSLSWMWLMLICYEKKVSLTGWWLVLIWCERKTLLLVASRTEWLARSVSVGSGTSTQTYIHGNYL